MDFSRYEPGQNLHRVGQTRTVIAYRMICRDTVEEKLAELQKKKRDLADAILHLMRHYDEDETINLGVGDDVTIKALAQAVRQVVGFEGELTFDTSKPDGTPRKLLHVSKLRATGWSPSIELEDGIKDAYQWFLDNYDTFRR